MLTDILLKQRPASRRDVADGKLPGFYVRLEPSGGHVFFIRFREAGRNRRLRLGSYGHMSLAEARLEAEQRLRRLDRGLGAELPEILTFAQLAQQYLEAAKIRKKSWSQDTYQLEHYLLPALAAMPAAKVRRRDVAGLLSRLALERGGTTANRCQSLLSGIFRHALDHELVDANPVAGLRRLATERPRTQVLTDEQLASAWTLWKAQRTVASRILRFALLTALRRSEICLLSWTEIDRDWWATIPQERMKGGRPHRCFLVPSARDLLTPGGTWCFPSRRRRSGREAGEPVESLGNQMTALGRTLGFRVGPHTLRRTVATRLGELGVAPHVIGEILAHAPANVTTRHYQMYRYDAERRAALLAWEARLLAIVGDH